MDIKVIILEDEFAIAEDIAAILTDAGYDVIGRFETAEDALEFTMSHEPDIVLVDIRLTGAHDGIHFVQELQKKSQVPTLYITANSDRATYERARATRPHAFLVKPFTKSNLLAAVDLALFHFSNFTSPQSIDRNIPRELDVAPFIKNEFLFVRTNGKFKKINICELLFIEASGSYVHLQTLGERFTLSYNLSHFQRKNPLPDLTRIHRSYVVNLLHVDSFDESSVSVKNHRLPLGDNYKSDFMERVRLL
jgi:DNA-binding LytR/AlgR family response regulator